MLNNCPHPNRRYRLTTEALTNLIAYGLGLVIVVAVMLAFLTPSLMARQINLYLIFWSAFFGLGIGAVIYGVVVIALYLTASLIVGLLDIISAIIRLLSST